MPVKVRCPKCEKVLNAPDSARGKAVKCPECETKVKVPVGDSAAGTGSKAAAGPAKAKTAVKKKADADSSAFLAALDLDKVEDSSEAMCPKCGAPIPEDATECPKCGVDPTTGQLTAAAKRRKTMKGPDPAVFYATVWKDSWAFMVENKKVALRTAWYMILFTLILGGCVFMVTWCSDPPPKMFWATLALAAGLAPPGWIWYLTIQTIRTTVGKKSNIRDINFDIFQNIALGVKFNLWSILFWGWFPPAIIMFPLAMIHMAMPVTKRGWVNFLMAGTFFKNIAVTLYFWVILFATSLIYIVTAGIAGFLLSVPIIAYIAAFQAGTGSAKNVMMWVVLGVALLLFMAEMFLYSFILLFNVRVIGLMAYYFQNTLDLVVLVAEKTYTRKEVKVDPWGNPIKTSGQKTKEALFIVFILVVVSAAGYFVYYSLTK